MNRNKDNIGERDWKEIYAQWDRKQLEAELMRTCERVRELRGENVQLQSRVRQLEEENRRQQAELTRLGVTNEAFATVALNARGQPPPPAYTPPEPSARFLVTPASPDSNQGGAGILFSVEQETRRQQAERQEDEELVRYESERGM